MAPDITPSHIAAYRVLAESAPAEIAEPMRTMCQMVEVFRETPESTLRGSPMNFLNASQKVAVVVPLEPVEIRRIDHVVPYDDEIKMWSARFESLPTGDLRNAAFHLLWFAVELSKGREPITREKLFSPEELARIDAAQQARGVPAPITLTARGK